MLTTFTLPSRQKSRQSTMCIVIKGVEKYITNIYDARHQMLKLSSERIIAAIPSTYYGPNDLVHFKNNSISQLLAGPTNYGPIPQVPQITWSNNDMNWRSRPLVESPLTSSLLQQHNKITGNLQIPGQLSMSRGSISDLHSSGYASFTDNSMIKSASSGLGSSHSSPENPNNYQSKYAQSLLDSPHRRMMDQARRNSMNETFLMNYDPRIVAGIRAMNMTPQQGEMRIPTPICKYSIYFSKERRRKVFNVIAYRAGSWNLSNVTDAFGELAVRQRLD